ncbi:MAG: phosphohydrolase [Lachnospiraceae bacterium]
MSSHISTYCSIPFTPLDPQEEQVDIRDIAHALSLLSRAGGHYPYFYSIAQHCIVCAKEAAVRGHSVAVQLECLLHDASEAYIADITRPVKQYLDQYLMIEKRLQDCIYHRYLKRLPSDTERKQIKSIDDAVLYHEFYTIKGEQLMDVEPEIHGNHSFQREDMECVEDEYLSMFHHLISIL